MRIAVYSGSFNPLHIGHLAIMQHLRDRFDWTYLVVSPKNPLKDSISADTGTDRYRAAVQAVCRHPELKVWVEDIELGMEPPHYTIRTLDALKAREPEHDYTLVIGADNLADIHRWRDFDRIMTEYGLAVYPRTGFDLDTLIRDLRAENPAWKIDVLDAPKVDISSTQIRDGLAEGRALGCVAGHHRETVGPHAPAADHQQDLELGVLVLEGDDFLHQAGIGNDDAAVAGGGVAETAVRLLADVGTQRSGIFAASAFAGIVVIVGDDFIDRFGGRDTDSAVFGAGAKQHAQRQDGCADC